MSTAASPIGPFRQIALALCRNYSVVGDNSVPGASNSFSISTGPHFRIQQIPQAAHIGQKAFSRCRRHDGGSLAPLPCRVTEQAAQFCSLSAAALTGVAI